MLEVESKEIGKRIQVLCSLPPSQPSRPAPRRAAASPNPQILAQNATKVVKGDINRKSEKHVCRIPGDPQPNQTAMLSVRCTFFCRHSSSRAFWCSARSLARSLVVVVVVASALLDKSSLSRHRRKRQQHPVAGGE
jgi:hypothetical protein